MTIAVTGVLYETDPVDEVTQTDDNQKEVYKDEIAWGRVLQFTYLHLAGLYGLYLAFTACQWKTLIFGKFMYFKE